MSAPFEFIKQKLRAIFLKGGNVFCNVCESSFLTFLPAGDEPRAHTRCPRCLSIDRQRQLWHVIKPNIMQQTRVLHISPEKGLSSRIRKFNGIVYYAIDYFTEGYNYPSYVQKMSLLDLKFENNSFDLIICSHVLEHIQDDKQAIKELFRVLNEKGVCYIIVPHFEELSETYENARIISPEERIKHFGQHDHVRKYGLDIQDKFIKAGFNVNKTTGVENMSQNEKLKYGFLHAEYIFELRKTQTICK